MSAALHAPPTTDRRTNGLSAIKTIGIEYDTYCDVKRVAVLLGMNMGPLLVRAWDRYRLTLESRIADAELEAADHKKKRRANVNRPT